MGTNATTYMHTHCRLRATRRSSTTQILMTERLGILLSSPECPRPAYHGASNPDRVMHTLSGVGMWNPTSRTRRNVDQGFDDISPQNESFGAASGPCL